MELEARLAEGGNAVGYPLGAGELRQLSRYCAAVIKWNRFANLTGARDEDDFARRFVVDAVAIRPYLQGRLIADFGSGAGLPGIVLAILAPDVTFHLVEARARRARFLERTRIELGLKNVEVHATRIERWVPPSPVDAVVCQAVGSLAFILEATSRLQRDGVILLALKGQAPLAELDALGPSAAACEKIRLEVPGWGERHLIRIDCARLPRPAD